jgi:hypothetical protein
MEPSRYTRCTLLWFTGGGVVNHKFFLVASGVFIPTLQPGRFLDSLDQERPCFRDCRHDSRGLEAIRDTRCKFRFGGNYLKG